MEIYIFNGRNLRNESQLDVECTRHVGCFGYFTQFETSRAFCKFFHYKIL